MRLLSRYFEELGDINEFLSAKPVKPKSFRLGSHGEGLPNLWGGALAWWRIAFAAMWVVNH